MLVLNNFVDLVGLENSPEYQGLAETFHEPFGFVL